MSWEIFKQNILVRANNPDSIKDIDTVAKLWATEYDACIKRGGDTINQVSLKQGNVELMEQLFKAALLKGQSTSNPYDLVGEMGKGVLAYWNGAILNEFPFPIIPAVGAIANIGVVSNTVTSPGTWTPAIPSPPGIKSEALPQEKIDNLLKEIPDDNNTVEGVQKAAEQTGKEFISDGDVEPGPQLRAVKEQLPDDNPPYEKNEEGEELEEVGENTSQTKNILCGVGVNYNSQISSNFRLKDLSISCAFPHKIRPQYGLSNEDIVCNLQNVAINILEPLKAEFPNLIVNSGFRGKPSVPGGISQHEKGEAVDVQFSGFSPRDYLRASKWVKKNLPYDQFIFEHGNSIWFHISCKRVGNQRNQELTMLRGKYEPGIKLYYS